MEREAYDGEWGGDYYIQRQIGFGTLHPSQGHIKISANLKYLLDNDRAYKHEFCIALIKVNWPGCSSDYKFEHQDPFDDIRIILV